MRLADFPDDAAYADFWASNPLFNTRWVYIGPTYNYGDGTDRWCHTMETIPKSIISNYYEAYESCAREISIYNERLVMVGGRTTEFSYDSFDQVTDYLCIVT